MNTVVRAVVSLFVGVAAVAVVGVGVTELLAPYVWPSALLGLPAGVLAGVVAVPLAFLGLAAREEHRSDGRVSVTTSRRFRASVAAAGGFLAGTALAAGTIVAVAGAVGTAIVVGLSVGVLVAVVAAGLVVRRDRNRGSAVDSPPNVS
jgi:hypothetical protein